MSKKEREDLGENPFLTSLEVLIHEVKSSDKYKIHDKNAGEDAIYERASFEYEATPYCKVFADAARRLHMVELTPRGKDLLMWLIYEIKPGKDWLHLNKERYMAENKISSINTYKAALKELIKKRFIGITVEIDYYWLNPHYFFNGNRIKAFPENVVVKATVNSKKH